LRAGPDYGTPAGGVLPAEGQLCGQRTQRIRWVNMPEPDPALLSGRLLFIDERRPGGQPYLTENFERVEKVAELNASAERLSSKPTSSAGMSDGDVAWRFQPDPSW